VSRRRIALGAAALLFATCGAVVAMPLRGPHRAGEAAIAIRDAVPLYQQLCTRQYTVPRLEAAYERSWYFTETKTEKKHVELRAALDEATRQFTHVDLYLLAHHNQYIDVVRTLSPEQRTRIRLVYDTGGGSASQGPRWMELGVGTFIGHPGGNIAPAFYVWFLPRWVKEQDAEEAMRAANEGVHDLLYGPAGSVMNVFLDRDALWLGTEAKLFTRPGGTGEPRSGARSTGSSGLAPPGSSE